MNLVAALLYSTERLPVAQQNTSLSVRNYQSTAATARILGADPVLADLVVNIGQFASPKTSNPSKFARGVVLSVLRMGQSTLGWLAEGEGSSNWFMSGTIRRQALQHWMSRGNSLPLIFPDEDLHFRYRDGALVKDASNRTSMPASDADASILQLGSRIPHCWLTVSLTKNDILTVDGPDFGEVCSTVQLSGLIDALLRLGDHSAGHISEAVAMTSTPTCSIWVSSRYSTDATAAVRQVNHQYFPDAFTVVGVERLGDESIRQGHDQLQAILQNPRYSIPASPNDSIGRDQKRTAADHSSPFMMRKHVLQSSHHDVRVLRVLDISNRWHDLLHRYTLSHPSSPTADQIAVVVRPDGHVAHIFPIHHGTSDVRGDIEMQLRAVAQALFLVRADGPSAVR